MGFKEAYSHVLAWESKGPGEDGMSFAGIDRRSWHKWEGWALPILTWETAEELVKQFYVDLWNVSKASEMGSLSTDYFDTVVLQGQRKAVALLQRMYNLLSRETLAIDGIYGDQTRIRLSYLATKVDAIRRLGVYRACRISTIIDLVEMGPHLERYLWGWLKRAQGGLP